MGQYTAKRFGRSVLDAFKLYYEELPKIKKKNESKVFTITRKKPERTSPNRVGSLLRNIVGRLVQQCKNHRMDDGRLKKKA